MYFKKVLYIYFKLVRVFCLLKDGLFLKFKNGLFFLSRRTTSSSRISIMIQQKIVREAFYSRREARDDRDLHTEKRSQFPEELNG